jgi:hypothetical protein
MDKRVGWSGGTLVVDGSGDVGQQRGWDKHYIKFEQCIKYLNKASNDQSYEATIINDQHQFKHP